MVVITTNQDHRSRASSPLRIYCAKPPAPVGNDAALSLATLRRPGFLRHQRIRRLIISCKNSGNRGTLFRRGGLAQSLPRMERRETRTGTRCVGDIVMEVR